MGKKLICALLFVLMLTTPVRAAEVPEEVTDAVPQQAEELLGDLDSDGTAGSFQEGLAGIWDRVSGQVGDILRERLREVPVGKPVYVICQSGLRSYIACRILAQQGFKCYNLSGGWRLYETVVRDRTAAQEAWPCGMEK